MEERFVRSRQPAAVRSPESLTQSERAYDLCRGRKQKQEQDAAAPSWSSSSSAKRNSHNAFYFLPNPAKMCIHIETRYLRCSPAHTEHHKLLCPSYRMRLLSMGTKWSLRCKRSRERVVVVNSRCPACEEWVEIMMEKMKTKKPMNQGLLDWQAEC